MDRADSFSNGAASRAGATKATQHARVRIGHVWIDALTFDEALAEIARLVEAREGGAVFTPNVDHLVKVEDDAEFRAAYDEAALSLVDGQPLIWASRLLGAPLPEKISGSDLILPLARRAAERGWRIYLLGGPPGVAALVAEKLRETLRVEIAGVEAPHVTARGHPVEGRGVIERIADARPHLVFVAFGAPKQELFIRQALPAIRPAVALGVGAGFDFVAERIKRAPRWISDNGLEWLFRLAQEPRRLARRYLVEDPRFVPILYRTLRQPRRERVREGGAPGT